MDRIDCHLGSYPPRIKLQLNRDCIRSYSMGVWRQGLCSQQMSNLIGGEHVSKSLKAKNMTLEWKLKSTEETGRGGSHL